MPHDRTTTSERETIAVAREFAGKLGRGDVVALSGGLGAGKTQFVKGICEAFRVRGHVSSPTFVIMNRYEGIDHDESPLSIYHLDLYRVQSIEEIYDLGFEEYLYGDGVCVIEWADRLGELAPVWRYRVELAFGEHETDRRIFIRQVESGSLVPGGRR